MFSHTRLLSAPGRANGIVLASIFVLGLGVGTVLGPVTISRGDQSGAPPSLPPRAAEMPGLLRVGHPADVLRVLDGDTFEARVHVWPGIDITTKVRLRGIDAPELTRPRCDEERVKALAARDALQAILDQGDVGVSFVTIDKYGGRVVAKASTRSTPDVSAALLGADLVRVYGSGRRESWC